MKKVVDELARKLGMTPDQVVSEIERIKKEYKVSDEGALAIFKAMNSLKLRNAPAYSGEILARVIGFEPPREFERNGELRQRADIHFIIKLPDGYDIATLTFWDEEVQNFPKQIPMGDVVKFDADVYMRKGRYIIRNVRTEAVIVKKEDFPKAYDFLAKYATPISELKNVAPGNVVVIGYVGNVRPVDEYDVTFVTISDETSYEPIDAVFRGQLRQYALLFFFN